jgi:hypothetical protein
LIPKAVVLVARGKSIGVKVPPWSRKPCDPVASEKRPTISPELLIPTASVEVAAGKSMALKAPVSWRKPCDPAASVSCPRSVRGR